MLGCASRVWHLPLSPQTAASWQPLRPPWLLLLLLLLSYHASAGSHAAQVLSVSIDFYVRVFVRLYTSPAAVKDTPTKLAYVFQSKGCDSFFLQHVGRKVRPGPPTSPAACRLLLSAAASRHGPANHMLRMGEGAGGEGQLSDESSRQRAGSAGDVRRNRLRLPHGRALLG